LEPTVPAADLPTAEPIKKPMTAEEKRAAQLATLARARAIRAEQLAADPNREKGKVGKVSKKEVLGQAMGDLSKIAARLQKH
jgi:hypothetical protein